MEIQWLDNESNVWFNKYLQICFMLGSVIYCVNKIKMKENKQYTCSPEHLVSGE